MLYIHIIITKYHHTSVCLYYYYHYYSLAAPNALTVAKGVVHVYINYTMYHTAKQAFLGNGKYTAHIFPFIVTQFSNMQYRCSTNFNPK